MSLMVRFDGANFYVLDTGTTGTTIYGPYSTRALADAQVATLSPAATVTPDVDVSGVAATGFVEFDELAGNPLTPGANVLRLFAKDNGSGVTHLYKRIYGGNVKRLLDEDDGASPATVYEALLPLGKIDATGRANKPTLFSPTAATWDAGHGYLALDLSNGNASLWLETDDESNGATFHEVFLTRADNANREAKLLHGVDNSTFTKGLSLNLDLLVTADEPDGWMTLLDYNSVGLTAALGATFGGGAGWFLLAATGATGQTSAVFDVQTAAGATSLFKATGNNRLGFFNATPAAKPTGVAVSAAGIHAALVTLGLIAA